MKRYKAVRVFLKVPYYAGAVILLSITGLFDKNWYGLQKLKMGDIRDRLPLILHYLIVGRYKGYTPHPLFIPEYFDTGARAGFVDPTIKYLLKKTLWSKPTHPYFDGSEYQKHAEGKNPLVHFIKHANNKTALPVEKMLKKTVVKPITYGEVRKKQTQQQEVWQQKENLRHTNKPASSYDYGRERAFVNQWVDTDLGDMVLEKPLVSIVMPSWNREKLIKEAIESLQNQTFRNWELIVGDDGSTDKTKEVIRSIAEVDPRIKLLELSHGGVCKARNAAMKAAKGDWIAFLDSDNTWTPNFLQVSIAAMQKQNMQAAYAAVKMNEANGVRYRINEPNLELLSISNYIDLNVFIVHKNIIKKVGYFDVQLRRAVDHDLILRVSKVAELHYLPIIGVNYTNHDEVARISNTELLSWGGVVKNKNIIDWDNVAKKRIANKTSIVVAVKNDLAAAARCITRLVQYTDMNKVEIVIVDSSSGPSMSALASSLSMIHADIEYIYCPESHDLALGSNVGFAHTTGQNVVFVEQGCQVEPEWLEPLLASLKSGVGIAAPMQLAPNRTITSAGILLPSIAKRMMPLRFLQHHPVEDTRLLDASYSVSAVSDGCIAVRATDFAKLQGFNPLFDNGFETPDLCMRANKMKLGKIVVAKNCSIVNVYKDRGWSNKNYSTFISRWGNTPTANSDDLWKKAGFRVSKYITEEARIGLPGKIRPLLERVDRTKIRWAIKTSSPADDTRFEWGDKYFAESIAKSLEKLGHEAIVDNRSSHDRPTAYLDDVLLSLRGLVQFTPQPDKLNFMWVISHPEMVTELEIKSFDKVYAAGTRWARDMTKSVGEPIDTLLQCVDNSYFQPPKKPNKEFQNKVLFVGNSRNVYRQVVKDGLKAGLDVAIYGSRWEQFVDEKYIKKQLIPNSVLPEAYGSAKVVLNDHWDDMRHWGFLSNRLFDATATGACIVSDRIEGASEIFGKLLYQYDTPDDLKKIDGSLERIFPGTRERLRLAEDIRSYHSFDARARTIAKDAELLLER